MKVETKVEVTCVCGQKLRQVAIDGTIITVTPCLFCMAETRAQAYANGMEAGKTHG
jgi:hypothetical protein